MEIMLNFVLLKHCAGHVHLIMINVLGQFGCVKFRIFVVVFFRQAHLKKIKINILYSKLDTSKMMSYQGH